MDQLGVLIALEGLKTMDKYSVVLDDEMTKTSGKGSSCPKCGATLSQSSHCNNCGTEPFEKRPVPQPPQKPKK